MTQITKLPLFILTTLLIFTSIGAFSQRHCGTTILDTHDMFDYKSIKSKSGNAKVANSVITIPIVFHVLYNKEDEKVDVDKLNSQIDVLNEDYRRQNTDATDTWPQAADVGVEFCLAKIDTNGYYFSGITETFTKEPYFDYREDKVFLTKKGGKDIWPGYLNIYVVNLAVDSLGVAGFSSLPGYDAYKDGVVMDYRFTGLYGSIFSFAYAGGRTGTHEVGHWLNLIHPWGAEADSTCILDDYVKDTPQSSLPYRGCEAGSSCGSEDMAENFMDYHYDYCMNLFTAGQAERIRLTIQNHPARTFLLNSTKCALAFDSINVEDPIINLLEVLKACNQITATNEVIQNADVSYISATSVSLLNNFSVDTSSNLSVYIEPCN